MRLALTALAVLAFAAAGCTSSPAASTSSSSASMPEHHHMAAQTVDVMLMNNQFSPANVTLYEGDSVRWTDMDAAPVAHNVHGTSGAMFNSNSECIAPVPHEPICMAMGDTYTLAFQQAGDVVYQCDIHAGGGMKGTIHVLPHPSA